MKCTCSLQLYTVHLQCTCCFVKIAHWTKHLNSFIVYLVYTRNTSVYTCILEIHLFTRSIPVYLEYICIYLYTSGVHRYTRSTPVYQENTCIPGLYLYIPVYIRSTPVYQEYTRIPGVHLYTSGVHRYTRSTHVYQEYTCIPEVYPYPLYPEYICKLVNQEYARKPVVFLYAWSTSGQRML